MCAKYYELRCMFKKNFTSLMLARAYGVKIGVIFGVWFERRKVDKKSKPTCKMKHANSILETLKYFCQKSSKSITIILSYTVSKLVHFFETQRKIFSANFLTGGKYTACLTNIKSINYNARKLRTDADKTKAWLKGILHRPLMKLIRPELSTRPIIKLLHLLSLLVLKVYSQS